MELPFGIYVSSLRLEMNFATHKKYHRKRKLLLEEEEAASMKTILIFLKQTW